MTGRFIALAGALWISAIICLERRDGRALPRRHRRFRLRARRRCVSLIVSDADYCTLP